MVNRDYLRIWVSDIAPHPSMNVLWMDLASNQYGSTIKYWNGENYVNLFPDVQFITDNFMAINTYDTNRDGIVDRAEADGNGDRIDYTYLKIADYQAGEPSKWEPDVMPDWIKPKDGKFVDASHIANLPEAGVQGPDVSANNNIAIFNSVDGTSIDDSGIDIDSLVLKTVRITYNELLDLKDNSNLKLMQTYLIVDYRTTYNAHGEQLGRAASDAFYGIISDDEVVCPVEPLIVTAASANTFRPEAFSTLHKSDIIYYNIDDNSNGATRGTIYRRIDTVKRNDIYADWRNIKYRYSKSNATVHYDSIPEGAELTAGSNLINSQGYIIIPISTFDKESVFDSTRFVSTSIHIGDYSIPLGDTVFSHNDNDYQYKSIIENYDLKDDVHDNIILYQEEVLIESSYFKNNIVRHAWKTLFSEFSSPNTPSMFENSTMNSILTSSLGRSINSKIDYMTSSYLGLVDSSDIKTMQMSIIELITSSNVTGIYYTNSSYINYCDVNISGCSVGFMEFVSGQVASCDIYNLINVNNSKIYGCTIRIVDGINGGGTISSIALDEISNCNIDAVLSNLNAPTLSIYNKRFTGEITNSQSLTLFDSNLLSSTYNARIYLDFYGNIIIEYVDEFGDFVINKL